VLSVLNQLTHHTYLYTIYTLYRHTSTQSKSTIMSQRRNTNDDDDGDTRQDPFDLIAKGNELESSNELWKATYHFLQASTVLRYQADRMHPINTKQRKVQALFQDQSIEYLHRARKTLISAMEMERDKDVERCEELPSRVEVTSLLAGDFVPDDATDLNMNTNEIFEPLMDSLDETEAIQRGELFQKLFISLKETVFMNAASNETGERDDSKPITLEQRLAQLESSLPPAMQKPKSDEQRMRDIHAGLNGLGVSVPSHNRNILQQEDISEEDQMKEIMSMAKDQAMLEGGSETKDVMALLKQSSIRIDLDGYDDDESTSSSSDEKDAKDADMQFWKNLVIEKDEEQGPTTKMEEMKQCLATAQQLMLQASVCLEALEESGFQMEEDVSIPEAEKSEEAEEGSEEISEEKEKVNHNASDDNSDVANDEAHQESDDKEQDDGKATIVIGDSQNKEKKDEPINPVAGMFKSNLDEAQELLERVLVMWPKKVAKPEE